MIDGRDAGSGLRAGRSAPPILRVARPSDDLDALPPFYLNGLGLKMLARFDDHNGFDGVILGHAGFPPDGYRLVVRRSGWPA